MIFDVSEKLAESSCKKSLINLRYQATTREFNDKMQEWNNFASEGYGMPVIIWMKRTVVLEIPASGSVEPHS